jgi:cyclopropane-fatty-acyl-phospholipid synthase
MHKWFKSPFKNTSLIYTIFNSCGLNIDSDFEFKGDKDKILKRWLYEGSLGIGETYMNGEWTTRSITLFDFFDRISNMPASVKRNLYHNWSFIFHTMLYRIVNINTLTFDRNSIHVHYDLGNDIYEKFLDKNMMYSCAFWKHATNLDEAQEHKLRMIGDKLKLKPGMTVLDIGCGWGGLAKFLADNYGVSVTGITIADEQEKLAKEKFYHPNVTILNMDYRLLKNRSFDRIVSVGMFEQVGKKNYDIYFKKAYEFLKDDGFFLLHSIGVNRSMKRVDEFILKYIFPNGYLPSIEDVCKAKGKFNIEDVHNFGFYYHLTLDAWKDKFMSTHFEGMTDKERRMWEYYFTMTSSGFYNRETQLFQFVFSKHRNFKGVYSRIESDKY